jgi:hypothetical protein
MRLCTWEATRRPVIWQYLYNSLFSPTKKNHPKNAKNAKKNNHHRDTESTEKKLSKLFSLTNDTQPSRKILR